MPYSSHAIRTLCTVDGCGKVSIARGYCDLHYRRWLHNGNLETKRPADWGDREKHPLHGRWTWFRRSTKHGLCEEWRHDFWRFVKDVGESPSPQHRLLKVDPSRLIGPDNFVWELPATTNLTSEEKKAYLRDWIRDDREKNPEKYRDKGLQKLYGIGAKDYDAMWKEQDGKCAICGEVETSLNHRTGLPRVLAVDHCHKERKVRKLLCHQCNSGLGSFKDSPALLRKAALYLESHV